MTQTVFSGKIKILSNNKEFSFKYNLNSKNPKMDDLLMPMFLNKFKYKDTKNLTLKNREQIFKFANILSDDLKIMTKKFSKFIKSIEIEHFEIEAENCGAFICLYAIKTDPRSFYNIKFTFKNSPIALLKKDLKKTNIKKFDIENIVDEESWLHNLKDLQSLETVKKAS